MLDNDGPSRWILLDITMVLLLHYFQAEDHAETKARLLSRGLARHLLRLQDSFVLPESALSDIVCRVMVDQK